MTYFNGDMHGWNDRNGYHPPKPTTEVYGDACAHAGAVPMDRTKRFGSWHWESGFRWAPWSFGNCHRCSRPTAECDKDWTNSPERAELQRQAAAKEIEHG